jgi:hypothetical protein
VTGSVARGAHLDDHVRVTCTIHRMIRGTTPVQLVDPPAVEPSAEPKYQRDVPPTLPPARDPLAVLRAERDRAIAEVQQLTTQLKNAGG